MNKTASTKYNTILGHLSLSLSLLGRAVLLTSTKIQVQTTKDSRLIFGSFVWVSESSIFLLFWLPRWRQKPSLVFEEEINMICWFLFDVFQLFYQLWHTHITSLSLYLQANKNERTQETRIKCENWKTDLILLPLDFVVLCGLAVVVVVDKPVGPSGVLAVPDEPVGPAGVLGVAGESVVPSWVVVDEPDGPAVVDDDDWVELDLN